VDEDDITAKVNGEETLNEKLVNGMLSKNALINGDKIMCSNPVVDNGRSSAIPVDEVQNELVSPVSPTSPSLENGGNSWSVASDNGNSSGTGMCSYPENAAKSMHISSTVETITTLD
jgi:hypothetical protein